MTHATITLLERYQIRKSKKQKEAFRAWLITVLREAGYSPLVESGGSVIKSSNVIVGAPECAKVVFTAHYDTCAVLPFPNFITPHNIFLYLLYSILIVIPIFLLAIAAEAIVLLCWSDCPLWLALLVNYAVLIFCLWWIMAGPANKHTANDNTSGVATLLEIALALPPEDHKSAAFVFFDNEEMGLLGSSLFKKMHGNAMKNTLLINYDCVSDGDHIHLFPGKTIKRDPNALALLDRFFTSSMEKNVKVVRGFGFYPSDQKAFPRGIGVAALHKSKIGYWLGRIHTRRDTIFDERNISLLTKHSLSLVSALKE